jgi:hypothetical protein
MFDVVKAIVFAVSPYALAPPLLLGLLQFRKLPLALKLICIHLMFAAVVEGLSYLLWHYRINNLFLLHIYTVEECGLILWFYSRLFTGFINSRVFLYAFAVFFVFAAVNSIFFQSLSANNTYIRTLEAIMVIVCSIVFFYRMLTDAAIEQPARSPYFWINTGWLIYFSASLLLFTLSNYINSTHLKQMRLDIWTLHAFFAILLYTFITIGLWKQRRK